MTEQEYEVWKAAQPYRWLEMMEQHAAIQWMWTRMMARAEEVASG